MSLDKAIDHGKERRKQYQGPKRIDKTCRNHGSCDYCKGNRLYKSRKSLEAARQKLRDVETNK